MSTTKKQIREITLSDLSNIDLEAAISELERELAVRARIYDQWVKDGKLSYTDAKDRYGRLLFAVQWAQMQLELEREAEAKKLDTQAIGA